MKKFFASIACVAMLSVSFATVALAQDATGVVDSVKVDSTASEQVAPAVEDVAAPAEAVTEGENVSFHQTMKTKFIEGGADFMAFIAITLVLGLAFCLERIIYLNLSNVNPTGMLSQIEKALANNDVEGAKKVARETRGPIASIAYQALLRVDQGIDVVEKSVISYGGVQSGLLEKNLSWITLFIAMAPSLGFLGTVIGMVLSFDTIEKVGDISPTVVAGGMKVALITTIFGLVVALILQVFYNYLLSLVEGIINRMEDASITILDLIVAREEKFRK